jgi:hypothetical protein
MGLCIRHQERYRIGVRVRASSDHPDNPVLERWLLEDPHLSGRLDGSTAVRFSESKLEDTDDGDWLATFRVALPSLE